MESSSSHSLSSNEDESDSDLAQNTANQITDKKSLRKTNESEKNKWSDVNQKSAESSKYKKKTGLRKDGDILKLSN